MNQFTFIKRAFTPVTGMDEIDSANNSTVESSSDTSESNSQSESKFNFDGLKNLNTPSNIVGATVSGTSILPSWLLAKKIPIKGKLGKLLKAITVAGSSLGSGYAAKKGIQFAMNENPISVNEQFNNKPPIADTTTKANIIESSNEQADNKIKGNTDWSYALGGGLLAYILGHLSSNSSSYRLPLMLALLGSGIGYLYGNRDNLNFADWKNVNLFKDFSKKASSEEKDKKPKKNYIDKLLNRLAYATGGATFGAASVYGIDKLLGKQNSDRTEALLKALFLGVPIGALSGIHLSKNLEEK